MIELFQLVKERCLLGNLNIRTEMHGEDREAAVDLKFSFSGANNLLAKLHPGLRAAFYRPNETRDLVNPDHMPHLVFPLLGPLSYDMEIPRTKLRVHDAEDAAHDVVMGGGKTNKFKLTMKEGGTVEFEFRCQFSKPDEDAVAKLMRVLNQVVPISLECADEEEKGDHFEQVEQLSLTGAGPSEARLAAELAFSAPPEDMAIANGLDAPAVDLPNGAPDTSAVVAVVGGDGTVLPVKKTRASRKAAVEIE